LQIITSEKNVKSPTQYKTMETDPVHCCSVNMYVENILALALD